jgi:hypothetical protein
VLLRIYCKHKHGSNFFHLILLLQPPFVSTSYLRTFNDFPGPMKKVKMKPEGVVKIPYETDAVTAFES